MNKTRFAKRAWRQFRSDLIEWNKIRKDTPKSFGKFSTEHIICRFNDLHSDEVDQYVDWRYKTYVWNYKDSVNMYWNWRGKHYYKSMKRYE